MGGDLGEDGFRERQDEDVVIIDPVPIMFVEEDVGWEACLCLTEEVQETRLGQDRG